jgi:hypothetical protein
MSWIQILVENNSFHVIKQSNMNMHTVYFCWILKYSDGWWTNRLVRCTVFYKVGSGHGSGIRLIRAGSSHTGYSIGAQAASYLILGMKVIFLFCTVGTFLLHCHYSLLLIFFQNVSWFSVNVPLRLKKGFLSWQMSVFEAVHSQSKWSIKI